MGSKTKSSLASSKLEKLMYSFGDVGANIVWAFSGSFLTMYYTDSVGLSAAYIGTMMLVCRLFDGASDLFMGIVVDKTRTKWGKARPWILFSALPLVLANIATYNVPVALSDSGKNMYAFITYFLLSVVFYTMNNIAYHAMLPRFSLTSQDRSTTSVLRSMAVLVAVLAMNIVTPALLASLGGDKSQRAWSILIVLYSAVGLMCMLLTFFGVKEKLPLDARPEKGKAQKGSMKQAFKTLLGSRYFYIMVAVFITFAITNGAAGIGIYYARDVLGDANLYGLTTGISVVPMVLLMPLAPALFKKFGKRNTMLCGLVLCVIASAFQLMDPSNLTWYLITAVFKAAGAVPLSAATYTLAGDVVDYQQMKTGIRAEGITTSANSLGNKLGTGLGSAILGWMLAWGHYDGALAVQPDSAIRAMIGVSIVVPMVVFALTAALLLFWDLDKYQPEVQEFLKTTGLKGQEAEHE